NAKDQVGLHGRYCRYPALVLCFGAPYYILVFAASSFALAGCGQIRPGQCGDDRRFLPRSVALFFENAEFIRDLSDRIAALAWSVRCTISRMRSRTSTPEGFCLLEVVVATTTLIVALTALAQLLTVA